MNKLFIFHVFLKLNPYFFKIILLFFQNQILHF